MPSDSIFNCGRCGMRGVEYTHICRRADVLKHTPAEKAIGEAIGAVEALPADTRLTDAVVLLQNAMDKVGDCVGRGEPLMPSKRPKTAKPKCPWVGPVQVVTSGFLRRVEDYGYWALLAENGWSYVFRGGITRDEADAICYALNATYPAAKGKRK